MKKTDTLVRKNPHAIALSKLVKTKDRLVSSSLGGKALVKKKFEGMDKKEISEIMKKISHARYAKLPVKS